MHIAALSCEIIGPVAPELQGLPLTFYACRVSAGFPSPADDYVEQTLDPAALLVRRPAATFFVRVSGPSMIGAGVLNGDILVVDRSIEARADDVVVAAIGGGLTVKRLVKKKTRWVLAAAHDGFPDIAIDPEEGVQIWGVVTWSLTRLCAR
jgi:DNA polymerase V